MSSLAIYDKWSSVSITLLDIVMEGDCSFLRRVQIDWSPWFYGRTADYILVNHAQVHATLEWWEPTWTLSATVIRSAENSSVFYLRRSCLQVNALCLQVSYSSQFTTGAIAALRQLAGLQLHQLYAATYSTEEWCVILVYILSNLSDEFAINVGLAKYIRWHGSPSVSIKIEIFHTSICLWRDSKA